jgi:hypothetical protein
MPVVGVALENLLAVDINPWDFKIGTLRKISVAFNGGLTAEPDWYFRRAGIQNDTIRIAMLVKKAQGTTGIVARVRAAWLYDPGVLRKVRVGTDTKELAIYQP